MHHLELGHCRVGRIRDCTMVHLELGHCTVGRQKGVHHASSRAGMKLKITLHKGHCSVCPRCWWQMYKTEITIDNHK